MYNNTIRFSYIHSVPPGYGRPACEPLSGKKVPMTVINFPAFLLPGEPKDGGPPAGLVFGIPDEERPAVRSFRRVLSHFSPPILFMTRYEAEVLIQFTSLCKAEKKHHYDRLMAYCEASGCDAVTIHRGIGLHPKIGQDSGYKKIRSASWVGDQVINYVVPARREGAVPTLCIWNDMENETEEEMVGQLQQWGYRFQQYYLHKQKPRTLQTVLYDNKWEAANNADAVLILSDSPAFSSIKVKEWQLQKERMKHLLIIDLCNSYEPDELEIAGCQYISPGRTSNNVTKLNKNT
jgi:UDP-glucose 6-dehydrogenase